MKRVLCAAFAAVLAVPLAAQEPGITRQQADDILGELRQIRQLLERQAKLAQQVVQQQQQDPPAQKVQMKIDRGYMLGAPNAPVTMVEFTDYQCPFCQRFHVSTFPDLKKNYIDTGKVRFYSFDLPLDFHPNAARAAESARCAGDQGQFWRMRDLLGSSPGKLSAENIAGYAAEISLDTAKFKECMDSGKFKKAVETDGKAAQSMGVNGTPSFVIGKTTAEGVDGELVVGALPLTAFEEKLKAYGVK
jgi:protein-disulfide isomerase